jgi:MOSC domain-containing protein YiiM
MTGGVVAAVSRGTTNGPGKHNEGSIRLVAGFGVEGDVHAGELVQHLSRKRRDPTQPNLRQVHLIHAELHEELAARGFEVGAGEMGENVTTRGIALLELPTGTLLRLGADAVVEVTGLRNPCNQLNGLAPGLMDAVLDRGPSGGLVRKCGVMGVVLDGGEVEPGNRIEIELPAQPHVPLAPV